MTAVTRSRSDQFFFLQKKPVWCGGWWDLLQKNPVRSGVRWVLLQKTPVRSGVRCPPPESGEDDGDGTGTGNEDEVEEVIQQTSAAGVSDKSILLLPERNEDKENKAGRDLKTPKESVEQSMGGRINCGTVRS